MVSDWANKDKKRIGNPLYPCVWCLAALSRGYAEFAVATWRQGGLVTLYPSVPAAFMLIIAALFMLVKSQEKW
jgi:hypothetical protein